MKTATVSELRNDFDRVSQWLESGETVQITKSGKPFARVVPEARTQGFLGCMAGTMQLPPDIDEPTNEKWKAGE